MPYTITLNDRQLWYLRHLIVTTPIPRDWEERRLWGELSDITMDLWAKHQHRMAAAIRAANLPEDDL